MQNVLPVRYPLITTLPQIADIISILGYYPETKPWICNNFIQLVFYNKPMADKNTSTISLRGGFLEIYNRIEHSPFFPCPFIQKKYLLRKEAENKWNSITDFIIYNINHGQYVYLCIDMYYIPYYLNNFEKRHGRHLLFIYGYDLMQKLLYIADFFENGKYKFKTISFDIFEEAYYKLDLSKPFDFDEEIFVINYSSKADINLDPEAIKNSLTDYLFSENIHYNYPLDLFTKHRYTNNEGNVVSIINRSFGYGISFYSELREFIFRLSQHGVLQHDIRLFDVIHDHKLMMLFRINYLGEHQCLKKS